MFYTCHGRHSAPAHSVAAQVASTITREVVISETPFFFITAEKGEVVKANVEGEKECSTE